jgi:integrase
MSKRAEAHAGSIYPWKRAGQQVGWAGAADVTEADGRRRRKVVYAKSQKEAREKLNAILAAHQKGELPTAGRLTLEAWLRKWLDRGNWRPKTFTHYEWLVAKHIIPSIGRKPLEKLTPSDVDAFLKAKLTAGLSPRTVHHLRACLPNALTLAKRDRLVTMNAAGDSKPIKVSRFDATPLSPKDARVLLDQVKADRLEALYVLAVWTGMRQGEVLGLSWSDVDLDAGLLHVRRQLQRLGGKPRLVQLKSESSRRTLLLPEPVIEALRQHQMRQQKEPWAAHWDDRWDLVFTGPQGEPLEATAVLRAFQSHLAAAGLPKVRFHDLRHTAASLLAASGVHAKIAQTILGHSNFSTTMDVYSHVAVEQQAEAVEALGRLLGT